ncbi:MAG: RHS repeat protein, partial [Acidobacteria bacterium]|nr:RHS repeat protein [Acidobacteriota bacterium]
MAAALFFKRSSNNEYLPLARRNWFAYGVKLPDNSYEVYAKGGLIYQFNVGGNLIAIKDRNNNQTTITRNTSSQRVETVTDVEGRSVNFIYNGAEATRVRRLENANGTIATYTYSGNSLSEVLYADGSKYKFLFQIVRNRNTIKEVRDFDNNILEKHEYYPDGRAKTSELHGGVEKFTLTYVNDTTTEVRDAYERLTTYTIERNRHRAVVTNISGQCACGGGGGNESRTWTYNEWGDVLTYTDGNNITTGYTWDANGNPATITNATGTTTYSYSRVGDLNTVTDQVPAPQQGVLTYNRDSKGNLLSFVDKTGNTVTFGTPDSRGLPPSVTDPRNKTTNFEYTPEGRLKKITDPLGQITQFEYYPLGKLKKIVNARGYETVYTYDSMGRAKTISEPAIDANGPAVTTFVYDKNGRNTEVIDPRGYKTTYGYDGAYRLLSEKNALNHTTTYAYDLMSNLEKITDALNRVTDIRYDEFYRLKEIEYPPATTGAARTLEKFKFDAGGRLKEHTDQANYVTAYQYDTANRPWKVTDAKQGVTEFGYNPRSFRTMVKDAKGQIYDFDYDKMGRPTTTMRGGVTMTYGYQNGVRTSRIDYNGAVTNYQYDELSRLKKILYPGGGGETLFTYDEVSNLKTATNVNGTVSFNYDARNRAEFTSDVWGRTNHFFYDKNSNRIVAQLNGGSPGGLQSMYLTYVYDAVNRLQSADNQGALTASFTYDAVNRLRTRALPNGVIQTADYDDLDRLKSLTYKKGTATLASFGYDYNTRNLITQMTDAAGTHTYGYDELQRLTSAAHPGGQTTESYQYDEVGNRTNSHFTNSYNTQPFNRVVQIGSTTFSYDNNGNLQTKTDGTGVTQYVYDYENRLMSVHLPGPPLKTIHYKYDALGRRIERLDVSTNAWQRYSYDGWEVRSEENSDGSWVSYVNGDGWDDHLWQLKSDGTINGIAQSYYLTDHQGSLRALTDANGNV